MNPSPEMTPEEVRLAAVLRLARARRATTTDPEERRALKKQARDAVNGLRDYWNRRREWLRQRKLARL